MVSRKESCDNKKGLPSFIKSLEDSRSNKGKRHELYVVVVIAIMAIMNQYLTFRAFEDYAEHNKKDFYKIFKLKKKRLPKRDTFRRVFQLINFEELNLIFEEYVLQELSLTKNDWISFDGKAIKHTLPKEAHFLVTLVSFFAQKSKKIILQGKVKHKSNEIPLVQNLLNHFEEKNVILTGDALHTQKKTINKIIVDKNSYVLCVKNNQKKLFKKISFLANNMPELEKSITIDKSRGRIESREVKTFENDFQKDLEELGWRDLNRIIKVQRTIFHKKNKNLSKEVVYYISNLKLSAKEFGKGIRNHWLIESMHWIKDVVFNEDRGCVKHENSSAVLSILRSFSLNIIRDAGFNSITKGIRMLMCDVKKMWKLIGGEI